MANSIIRSKKSANPRQRKIMEECAIDERDLAFCDLVAAGWSERLAAFYAYSLTSDRDSSIDTFVRNQKQYHPGIRRYMEIIDEAKNEETRNMQRKMRRMQSEMMSQTQEDCGYDLRSKSGMLDYLVDMSHSPGLDVKTRADIAKQITDLMQFKKEEIKEEDNRINFYLPLSCRYCSLYQKSRSEEKEHGDTCSIDTTEE